MNIYETNVIQVFNLINFIINYFKLRNRIKMSKILTRAIFFFHLYDFILFSLQSQYKDYALVNLKSRKK